MSVTYIQKLKVARRLTQQSIVEVAVRDKANIETRKQLGAVNIIFFLDLLGMECCDIRLCMGKKGGSQCYLLKMWAMMQFAGDMMF